MRKRVEMHRLEEMVRLHRMGTTKHELARMLVMSPNTVSALVNRLPVRNLGSIRWRQVPDLYGWLTPYA